MTTLAINKLWANYPLSPESVEMTLKNLLQKYEESF